MTKNAVNSRRNDSLACDATEAAPAMNGRERFLRACAGQSVDRPPIWLMRQAGRALPEYRALKLKHTFLELVQDPELAAEVTLQPVRRFGFDAAILFSDILIAAEGLGQRYRFHDPGGIELDFLVQSPADIDRLSLGGLAERLSYVPSALRRVKSALGQQHALLGFAGAPWTLANFMMQGSVREYGAAKHLFYSDRKSFGRLCEKLTSAVTELLQMQIDAGADAVQIFDSLGGALAGNVYAEASGRWIAEIITALQGRVPVIVFARGVHGCWDELRRLGGRVLSVDWTVSLSVVRREVGDSVALQGNLDPQVLTTTPEVVRSEAARILEEMRGRNGHIFNLGHGVPPEARLECIQALVDRVRQG